MAHAMSSGRLLTVCALMVVSAATDLLAGTASVDLLLDPPSTGVNTLDVTVTAVAWGTNRSDSDTTTVTGNAVAALTFWLDPMTCEVTVTGLEFTGGRIAVSNPSFTLSYGLLGSINASGNGISGTLDTPVPPGSVSAGIFPASEHEMILDSGTFNASGTGLVGGLFSPISINLADEPIHATAAGDGFLTVSPPALVGHLATYDVTLTLPVDFQEQVLADDPLFVDVAGVGLLRARGNLEQVVPDPPTPQWTGGADGHWENSGNWSAVLPPGPGSTVIFDAAAPRQPILHRDEGVAGIEFRTSGWTVTGGFTLTVGPGGVASAGAGTNTLAADVVLADVLDMEVAALGTLVFEGLLDNSAGLTFTKMGAGVLVIDGPQEHGPGACFDILGGTVEMNTDASGTGLMDDAHLWVLVTDAVLNFGCNQHLDTLEIGDGGLVRLIGANVVVVKHLVMNGIDLGATTLTPEPATLALLALGGLAVLRRGRPRSPASSPGTTPSGTTRPLATSRRTMYAMGGGKALEPSAGTQSEDAGASPASEQGSAQAEGGRPDRKTLPCAEALIVPFTLTTYTRQGRGEDPDSGSESKGKKAGKAGPGKKK